MHAGTRWHDAPILWDVISLRARLNWLDFLPSVRAVDTDSPRFTGNLVKMATVTDTIYRLEEVKKHNSPQSAWVAIHDRVYDITKFLDEVCKSNCSFLPIINDDDHRRRDRSSQVHRMMKNLGLDLRKSNASMLFHLNFILPFLLHNFLLISCSAQRFILVLYTTLTLVALYQYVPKA